MKSLAQDVRELLGGFIDLLYPPRCLLCHAFLSEGPWPDADRRILFCRPCLTGFSELSSPRCKACCKPFVPGTGDDRFCEDCLRRRPRFDSLLAPYLYEGNLMEAIHHLKYGARAVFAGSLGSLLGRYARWTLPDGGQMLVMPVPLHPRRLRERGFNQSLLLARHVAKELGAELDFMSLRRERYTLPQTGLPREARRKNVRRAFQVTAHAPVRGREVLLVDDVATTGNTLEECARVLRKAGCHKVFCLVLARAADPRAPFRGPSNAESSSFAPSPQPPPPETGERAR